MEAITRGAYDFFTKPLKMDEFQVVVARALDRRRLQKQVKALRDSQPSGLRGAHRPERGAQARGGHGPPRGAHRPDHPDPGRERHRQGTARPRDPPAERRARTARSCRSTARRSRRACSSRELFGHERGAFTGAHPGAARPLRAGRRGHALPRRDRRHAAAMQAKILRVLQERRVRAGGRRAP